MTRSNFPDKNAKTAYNPKTESYGTPYVNMISSKYGITYRQLSTTAGSGTFTIPSGINFVYAIVVGGGGAGGYTTSSTGGAAGGGAGGYAEGWIHVPSNNLIPYVVGAGGPTGANFGQNGGYSRCGHLIAGGGGGGAGGTGNALGSSGILGGAGGGSIGATAGAAGSTNMFGQTGQAAIPTSTQSLVTNYPTAAVSASGGGGCAANVNYFAYDGGFGVSGGGGGGSLGSSATAGYSGAGGAGVAACGGAAWNMQSNNYGATYDSAYFSLGYPGGAGFLGGPSGATVNGGIGGGGGGGGYTTSFPAGTGGVGCILLFY